MTIDFIALDFETANKFRGSPCSVGVVVVQNSEIIEEYDLLMKPPEATGPEDFDDFNVALHGIDWGKVKDQPSFLEVWNSLLPTIGNLPLVAHNAAFDIGVLRDSLDISGAPWPNLNYACTLVASRRLLKIPSYSLPYVAAELNVALGKHHDALSDAKAAAGIMIELCKRSHANDVDSFLESVSVKWGKISEGNWSGSTVRQRYIRNELPLPRTTADKDHFLFGQHVVITGALPSGILRSRAQERIAYFGATPQENVTKETSLLVVGDIDPHRLAPGSAISSKMKKAIKLQSEGQAIEIMAGFDFLPLLE
jgi:DNA polymerase III epsilon subunit-like protein